MKRLATAPSVQNPSHAPIDDRRRSRAPLSMFELTPADLELAVGGQGVISEVVAPPMLSATRSFK